MALAAVAAVGAAVGPILYGAAAVGGVGLAAASFLTTPKPAGLHHSSQYIYDTFEKAQSHLEHVKAAIYAFDKIVESALEQKLIHENLLARSEYLGFITETKQILTWVAGSLSSTNNKKLAQAFQGLHLLVWHIQQPVYAQFWDLLRLPEVMPGEIANLLEVFNSRHPLVTGHDPSDGEPGMQLAIASTYIGWFLGMNNWTRVLAGDLPGRLSSNNRFQKVAKSPIRFINLSQHAREKQASKGHSSRLKRSDSMDSAYSLGAAPTSASDLVSLKSVADSCWTMPSDEAIQHGDKIRLQFEDDHFLYQPKMEVLDLAFWRGDVGPAIGKVFWRDGAQDRQIWQIQHVTAESLPSLTEMIAHLPIVVGDTVAFFFKAWWDKDQLRPLYTHKPAFKHVLDGYTYGLYSRPKTATFWSDKCAFTIMKQETAAGWDYKHIAAN